MKPVESFYCVSQALFGLLLRDIYFVSITCKFVAIINIPVLKVIFFIIKEKCENLCTKIVWNFLSRKTKILNIYFLHHTVWLTVY